jgi:methylated-DNA-protein-cysteine methyltransferase-like protein
LSQAAAAREAILAVVAAIPKGKVASYGQVAAIAGLPRRARLVGRVLSRLPPDSTIPWQRVVNARGEISLAEHDGGKARQRRLLEGEGIVFNASGRIPLRRFGIVGDGRST